MSEAKTAKTRIKLKYDSLSSWEKNNPTLLQGELAIVTIPEANTDDAELPPVMFKVGDGENDFKTLGWTSAKAADVYDWAKEKTLSSISNELTIEPHLDHKIFLGLQDDKYGIRLTDTSVTGVTYTTTITPSALTTETVYAPKVCLTKDTTNPYPYLTGEGVYIKENAYYSWPDMNSSSTGKIGTFLTNASAVNAIDDDNVTADTKVPTVNAVAKYVAETISGTACKAYVISAVFTPDEGSARTYENSEFKGYPTTTASGNIHLNDSSYLRLVNGEDLKISDLKVGDIIYTEEIGYKDFFVSNKNTANSKTDLAQIAGDSVDFSDYVSTIKVADMGDVGHTKPDFLTTVERSSSSVSFKGNVFQKLNIGDATYIPGIPDADLVTNHSVSVYGENGYITIKKNDAITSKTVVNISVGNCVLTTNDDIILDCGSSSEQVFDAS